ncbi:MAG TPA: UDP-N-acetylmuramoyl-tripeptide--D-alanyl-D-alanine ligase [Verrucomicrobiae bacterium]|nr:UDP-N-acetylmuramoyl-tripeptide--D-alanyl-D-alanine ligase [Verrucomicrobiae bacterium]
MEPRPLQFIVRACAGELSHGDPHLAIHGVCTDSRKVKPGEVFFALAGEKFDAHDFLPEVVRRAAAVVVKSGRAPSDPGACAVVTVADPRQALGLLAAQYRREFNLPVIAVGGSNGKTTTKELIASVLRQKFVTLWSEASFNNDVGVPLTLLRLQAAHRAAVLEAGTNHPGELEPLIRVIGPGYGVITSIAREHLEFFGDLAGVAREEAWIAEGLPASGKVYVHADEEWVRYIRTRTRAQIIQVGMTEGCDWQASGLRPGKQGVSFIAKGPASEFEGEYHVNLLGRHQSINALMAVALGAELGLDRSQIQQGLTECKPARMRLQLWEINGVRVLDDAYNANADSMVAALRTLQDLPCKGRRLAVLGDMAELGRHSEAAHEEVGRRAAELGVGQLFAVGRMAPIMARGARQAGLARVMEFADVDTAAIAIKQFVREGDVLLIKASRATRLERVSERLRAGEASEKN